MNSKKYKLTCMAPTELTQYNEKWNQEIKDSCYQKDKFQPKLDCIECKWLEVKGYK